MPNRRLTDDDIAEFYRRSSLNPDRFTARFYEGLDYVTSRRFALRPRPCRTRPRGGPNRKLAAQTADERRALITNIGQHAKGTPCTDTSLPFCSPAHPGLR